MLINCPECGGKVSDQAPACIHCGFPLENIKILQEKEEELFYDITIDDHPFGYYYKQELGNSNPSEQFKIAKEYLRIERLLLREVLGYTPDEAIKIVSDGVKRTVINVDSDTACKIIAPFIAWDLKVYIYQYNSSKKVEPESIKGFTNELIIKKDHYYDTPVVTREHLCDVLKPQLKPMPVYKPPIASQPQPTNVPKCPTCGSTNVKKISDLNRAASVSVFGLFSKKINKSFKCESCGYTW